MTVTDTKHLRALLSATRDGEPGWTTERADAVARATYQVLAALPALLDEIDELRDLEAAARVAGAALDYPGVTGRASEVGFDLRAALRRLDEVRRGK